VARTLPADNRQVNVSKGQMISCGLCHKNPM
jgi:hypothetical protein